MKEIDERMERKSEKKRTKEEHGIEGGMIKK
jgi:hypothetical protein